MQRGASDESLECQVAQLHQGGPLISSRRFSNIVGAPGQGHCRGQGRRQMYDVFAEWCEDEFKELRFEIPALARQAHPTGLQMPNSITTVPSCKTPGDCHLDHSNINDPNDDSCGDDYH